MMFVTCSEAGLADLAAAVAGSWRDD